MTCERCWLKYSSYCPLCRGEYWCDLWIDYGTRTISYTAPKEGEVRGGYTAGQMAERKRKNEKEF